ncbi:histone deacetylase family protein [Jiella sp. MQZ9-1]|uniref:Histone deacetylase family protein n=1 Tax=Jiella flava TaxID=2816857 RepID=A0A939JVL7_9HYPH|nr:histone deacetylase family protein [Jiella flava]MBO0662599.1 histone deacetylase family protein [Jiella flava]MCD2471021.1 histone deacetylase family protein [Jiella flava]
MKLFFSQTQLDHRPTQYGVHGKLVTPLENPNRAETLVGGLGALGLSLATPPAADRAAIARVHAGDYLDFLASAYQRFRELPNVGPEVLPNVHPYFSTARPYAPEMQANGARPQPRTTGILGQTGWYIGDLSCAMTAGTYEAALASAASAIAAARAVRSGETAAFALCRPPGHHAYADRASGFCFLNNAAIAAETLRERYAKVAIIDFDTHHGDGTQTIFYARNDIFFGSVHTDPSAYYPHFLGYADEIGTGAGEGCNRNRPLAFGSGDDDFLAAIAQLIDEAVRFGAEALVISAGWDAHRQDPLSRLEVTTDAYPAVGTMLGELKLPSVIIQEGGYSLAAVSEAAPAFVEAFMTAHGD